MLELQKSKLHVVLEGTVETVKKYYIYIYQNKMVNEINNIFNTNSFDWLKQEKNSYEYEFKC